MEQTTWTPGHAINNGYPYEKVETDFLFPNRLAVRREEDGKISVDFDETKFPPVETEIQERDFILFRLFDYSEALKVAEDQIRTLLEEEPFIPEEFGFEVVAKPETIYDSPIRIYSSKHDESYSLYREVQDISKRDFNPENWVLMKKKEDGTFDEIKVKLPCHRIAYAVFYGLGVSVEPAQNEAGVGPVLELPPVVESALFDVTFNRDDVQAIIPSISAINESDARTKALFLFQTDDFYTNVPRDIEFTELTVVPSEKAKD